MPAQEIGGLMSAKEMGGLISFVGIVMQLGGACLLAVLFYLLHKQARRRRYFIIWGWGWGMLCLAIEALAIRYHLSPTWGAADQLEGDPSVRVLYFVYQFSKLVFGSLLVLGTLTYSGDLRMRPGRFLVFIAPAAAFYAALSVGRSADLNHVVLWQIPVAFALFVCCAAALLRLPRSRRGTGTKMTGLVFAVMALLWLVYLVGFGFGNRLGDGLAGEGLRLLLHYNSFVDLLLQMLLGYGMVVMLMEDAKREVDDARARLEIAHDGLRHRSFHDVLTGVLNRHAFSERVGLDFAGATYGAVVVLDLDNLKEVNDLHGHMAGDALLSQLADALRRTLRAADGIYRWGGDEFLAVMPGSGAAEAQRRVEAAIASGGELRLAGDAVVLRLAVSTGAAPYTGAEDLDAAIRSADAAMYRQKNERKKRRALEEAGQKASGPAAPGAAVTGGAAAAPDFAASAGAGARVGETPVSITETTGA